MSRRAVITLIVLVVLNLAVSALFTWLIPLALRYPSMGMLFEPGVRHALPIGPMAQRGGGLGLRQGAFWAAATPLWRLGRVVATEVFFFLAGALVLLLFARPLGKALRAYSGPDRKNAFLLFGVGLLSVVVLCVLGLLGILSVVGVVFVPLLALLGLLIWAIGLVAATERVGHWVGSLVRLSEAQPLLSLALGVLALTLVISVPVLGWLVFLVAGIWGIGAVVASQFARQDSAQADAASDPVSLGF